MRLVPFSGALQTSPSFRPLRHNYSAKHSTVPTPAAVTHGKWKGTSKKKRKGEGKGKGVGEGSCKRVDRAWWVGMKSKGGNGSGNREGYVERIVKHQRGENGIRKGNVR